MKRDWPNEEAIKFLGHDRALDLAEDVNRFWEQKMIDMLDKYRCRDKNWWLLAQ